MELTKAPLFILALLMVKHGQATAQACADSANSRVLDLVTAQANAEYGLVRGTKPKRFGVLDFQVGPALTVPGIVVCRVLVQTSNNRHPYLVAVMGRKVWRLGGFSSPELIEVSSVIAQSKPRIDIRDAALHLARLGDEHAALEFASAQTFQPKAWAEERPSDWPADTVDSLDDGNFAVTLTVFSRAVEDDFADGWDPLLYRMVFQPNGTLVAWAKRRGERLAGK